MTAAPLHVLAIAGSLRRGSTHAALLRAASAVVPAGVRVELYAGLGTLPIFNPDLTERLPKAAAELRQQALEANGFLIASPEYAHGVTGALKNALDWMVGWGELAGMPVALFHTLQYGGQHARANLVEILTTMSMRVVPEVSLTVRMRGKNPAEMQVILASPQVVADLQWALAAFALSIRSGGRP